MKSLEMEIYNLIERVLAESVRVYCGTHDQHQISETRMALIILFLILLISFKWIIKNYTD